MKENINWTRHSYDEILRMADAGVPTKTIAELFKADTGNMGRRIATLKRMRDKRNAAAPVEAEPKPPEPTPDYDPELMLSYNAETDGLAPEAELPEIYATLLCVALDTAKSLGIYPDEVKLSHSKGRTVAEVQMIAGDVCKSFEIYTNDYKSVYRLGLKEGCDKNE